MRAESVFRRARLAACLSPLLASFLATNAHAALCGDTSGDGFVTSTDALATLRRAVGGAYDRRGDVKPAGGDGKLLASDALETLRAAVESRLLSCAGGAATKVVVTTAPFDFFGAGGFATVDVATRVVAFRGGAISGDAVIRTPGGIPVVVNRQSYNTLQTLDHTAPALPNRKECSVSGGFDSNPQDVVFVSEHKGYVTAYGDGFGEVGDRLLVIDPAVLLDPDTNPACNGILTGHIDLSAYDSDGIPQMDQMALVGSDLFVTLQLLDDGDAGLAPKENGLIVVIDTDTDTVKATIPLGFRNPFGETKGIPYDEFTGLLYTGGPGNTGSLGANLLDGGIEAIDPQTMQSAGMLITGADLGLNIFDFVIVGTRRAFAIVANDVANSVVELDLKERSVKKTLLSSDALITDIEMTEQGELWVAYRGETKQDPSGLRVFRATSDPVEIPEGRIPLGQAPFTLTFVP